MVEPAAQRNENIVKAAKAFNRLPDEQKTRTNALKIFALFNTNNAGDSKDKLTDADKIDDYFKDVMGLSVMNTSISQDDFVDNIEDWVSEFAKYKAPKPKKEPKTPITYVPASQAENLADQLQDAAEPDMGNNWLCDTLAFDNDDDARYKRTKKLFDDNGDPNLKINMHNIVEVLDNLDLEEFRYAIYTFDDKDELKMLRTIKRLLQERIDALTEAGIAVPDAATAGLNAIEVESGRGKRSEFKIAVQTCVNALKGLGVAKKPS